jgi:hypothetical protein
MNTRNKNRSVEQISFTFGKIQWSYFLPDGTPIRGGCDVSGNQSF